MSQEGKILMIGLRLTDSSKLYKKNKIQHFNIHVCLVMEQLVSLTLLSIPTVPLISTLWVALMAFTN